MIYFKNSKGEVFAYETEADRQKFGSKDLIQLTEDDIKKHQSDKSSEDQSYTERSWRDSELIRADIELCKVQDSDPKAVGTVAGWREYRKALRAWPEHESFPDSAQRPVAPDVPKEPAVGE